jgi:SAM-dependent MidA family methyltransferase
MAMLKSFILEKIRQLNGKIPFSQFMEMALYYPELGYYMKENHPFGREGDFITAPEISPLFGLCIARSISPILSTFQHPIILEFGAGTGKLAKTLLEHCEFIENYWILEISPSLRREQQKTLEKYLSRVTWLETLPEESFEGIILANEIIDAFPATRFYFKNNTVYEYYVSLDNDEFKWHLDIPSDLSIINFVKSLELISPYSSELHLSLKPWIHHLGRILKTGIILLFDYGFPRHEFYHPERHEGTLMCHSHHKMSHNPLLNLGLQDITAHVDFTAVAESAVEAHLDVSGYTSQAAFLLECGITEFAKNVLDNNAIKILTLPQEMGELFKVMSLSKNADVPLLGFTLHDRRNRL